MSFSCLMGGGVCVGPHPHGTSPRTSTFPPRVGKIEKRDTRRTTNVPITVLYQVLPVSIPYCMDLHREVKSQDIMMVLHKTSRARSWEYWLILHNASLDLRSITITLPHDIEKTSGLGQCLLHPSWSLGWSIGVDISISSADYYSIGGISEAEPPLLGTNCAWRCNFRR